MSQPLHLKADRPVLSDRRIRFAVVGCGRISESHFGALEAHAGDCELVAVCDTHPLALADAERKTGVAGFRSIAELLAGSEPDVVVLCTPSGLHAEQGIRVAQAGRHVVSEKPMATRWQDGKDFVRACDAAGVYLFVVKQNRCNPTIQLLKRAVTEGRFGRIYLASVNVFWQRPQAYYDSAAWRGTWEFDGGAFMNQASHYIDLLDWIVGPVESVQSFTGTLARNIQVEDTGVASIRWRTGALGSVSVTMLTYPKNLEGSLTILGEKGTVRIGGIALNQVEQWEFTDERPEDTQVKDSSYQTSSVYGHGHRLYYENVIQTLRGEATPMTDGREGLHSLELLIALYLAARDGKRVALPLDY